MAAAKRPTLSGVRVLLLIHLQDDISKARRTVRASTRRGAVFAERLTKTGDASKRIELGLKMAYRRPPSEGERASSERCLAKLQQS